MLRTRHSQADGSASLRRPTHLMLVIASTAIASSAPKAEFAETFDAYDAGADVIAGGRGRFKTVTPKTPFVRGAIREAGDAERCFVLEHKSATTSVITRFVDGQMPRFNRALVMSLDVRPSSGKHGIYVWEGERRHKIGCVKLWFQADGMIIAIVGREGKQAHAKLGKWQPGQWHRLTLRFRLSPSDRSKTRFDAEVRWLAGDRVTGEVRDQVSPWSPATIAGAQILSSLDRKGKLDAQFDNWVFRGDAVRSTKRAAKRQVNRSGAQPFTPKTPCVTAGEIVSALKHEKPRSNHGLAISPNGETLASVSSGGNVHLWNIEAKKKLRTIKADESYVRNMAFSPDGKMLATCGRGQTVKVWLIDTGEPVQALQKHETEVYRVAFSPDSKHLVSCDKDGYIAVWDLDDKGNNVAWFRGPNWHVQWMRDSKTIAVASGSGVWFYGIDPVARKAIYTPMPDGQGVLISSNGHYSGTPGVQKNLIYQAVTLLGQLTLTPEEFEKRFGWKNDPTKVKLIDKVAVAAATEVAEKPSK